MSTVSELMILSGANEKAIRILGKFGLPFEEDGFQIDEIHKKAINDLRNKRLSPLVLAYAWRCSKSYVDEDSDRFFNLVTIAKFKGLSLSEALLDIRSKQFETDMLPTAQHWVDCATRVDRYSDALQRLALWCKDTLRKGPPFAVEYPYLGTRLLVSLPMEVMRDYPRPVLRALNRIKHYGLLDGWHRVLTDDQGEKRTVFFVPKYDL